jgi:hypothetical protein
MEELYYILDLRVNPAVPVPGADNLTIEQAIEWVNNSGVECPACSFTIIIQENI